MSVDINSLKEKMREAGCNPHAAAAAMGMNTATYYRKLKEEGVKFTVEEMQKIIHLLGLSKEEAAHIFFGNTVA